MNKHKLIRYWMLALCGLLLAAMLRVGQLPVISSALAADGAANSCPSHSILRVDASVSGGTGDGGSWANAYSDLQPALTTAKDCANVTELWVAAGNYVPGTDADATFALANNIALYGGFAGTETARAQRDWASNVTTLNGRYSTSPNRQVRHVVRSDNLNATAVLDGFVIKNGNATLATGMFQNGGGLRNTAGQPTLRNLVFEDNYAYAGGGGLYNTASNLTLTNITFRNNVSQRTGGGLHSATSDGLVLRDVVFEGNNVTEFGGGGVRMGGSGTATFTNVIFRNNTAEYGGGFYSLDGVHQFTNVVFVNNVARRDWDPNVGGGGVQSYNSTLHFVNTTFFGNSAGAAGGGLWAEDSSVTLGNSILWGNTAPDGPQYKLRGTATLAVTYSNLQQPSGVHPGTGNINANPYFVDAANGNLRLQLGSYCIDSGNNAAVPAGVTTDLEGRPRFVDIPMVPDTGSGTPPLVDMGAYEAFLHADVTLHKTVTSPSAAPGQPLTFVLTLANQGNIPATQVVITDTLALLTGATFTSDLIITNTGHLPAYVWAVQDLLPGQGGVITVTGLVQIPTAAGAYLNTAVVSAAEEAYPHNNTATVNFTVLNVPPLFTSEPVTAAVQTLPYTYAVVATDANGVGTLAITAPGLPVWLALTDHGNGSATLAGTPDMSHLGPYPVTLRSTDGGGLFVDQSFTITVTEAPFVDVALNKTVAPGSAAPGQALTFVLTLVNQGNIPATQVIVTDTLALLTGMAFTSDLSITNTGHLPAYVWAVQDLLPGQSGVITVTGHLQSPLAVGTYMNTAVIAAANDTVADNNTATATFNVLNVPPLFTSEPVTAAVQTLPYTYAVVATDANGVGTLAITAPGLPAWLALTDHGNGSATLAGTPNLSHLGPYPVTLRSTDGGGLFVDQSFTIIVTEAPFVDVALSKAVMPGSAAPGQALTFVLTLSNQGNIPATQVVVTDTVALLTGVTFTSDLLITNTGHLPAYVWAVQDLLPGQSGVITVTGRLQSPLAVGTYMNTAVIAAADDTVAANNTATATFNVLNVPPVFTSAPVTAAVQTLPYTYVVVATDANGVGTLSITAPGLPAWLALTDHGNGLATLAGTPNLSHLGPYPVTLRSTDGGGLFVEQSFTIIVTEAPFVDVALSKAVTPGSAAPGQALTFVLTLANHGNIPATQVVVTDTVALLTGATFTSDLIITNTGHLPAYVWAVQDLLPGQSGVITVTGRLQSPLAVGTYTNTAVIAAANDTVAANNTATATFTVLNVSPVFTSMPVNAAVQDMPYTYAIVTADANSDAVAITAPTLPTWLLLTDHGNGTATLSGVPDSSQLGAHAVVLRVTDSGGLFKEQAFTIAVSDTPYVDVTLSKVAVSASVAPGEVQTFVLTFANQGNVAATQIVVTDTVALLTGATFTSDLTITNTGYLPAYVWAVPDLLPGHHGVITVTGFLQVPLAAGVYTNTAVITAANDTEADNNIATATFTVLNVPPIFTSMPGTTAAQGILYTYNVVATDANGDVLTMTATTLPEWLDFSDLGAGMAALSGTPDSSHVGPYSVTLQVTDSGGLFTQQSFIITVSEALRLYLPLIMRQ